MKSESLWLGPDTNILLTASQVILIGSQLGEPLIHKNRRLDSLELYHTALGWMLGLFPPFLGPGQGTLHWRCLWLCSPKDSLTYPKENQHVDTSHAAVVDTQGRTTTAAVKSKDFGSLLRSLSSCPAQEELKAQKEGRRERWCPPSLPVQIPQAEAWLAVRQFCVAQNWMWD